MCRLKFLVSSRNGTIIRLRRENRRIQQQDPIRPDTQCAPLTDYRTVDALNSE